MVTVSMDVDVDEVLGDSTLNEVVEYYKQYYGGLSQFLTAIIRVENGEKIGGRYRRMQNNTPVMTPLLQKNINAVKIVQLESVKECLVKDIRTFHNSPGFKEGGRISQLKDERIDIATVALDEAICALRQFDTLCDVEVKEIGQEVAPSPITQ